MLEKRRILAQEIGYETTTVADALSAVEEQAIKSDPPSGKRRIVNIFWDPVLQECCLEYKD